MEKLAALRAALATVQTRGQDTIIMANCLLYLDKIIEEGSVKPNVQTESNVPD